MTQVDDRLFEGMRGQGRVARLNDKNEMQGLTQHEDAKLQELVERIGVISDFLEAELQPYAIGGRLDHFLSLPAAIGS